MLKKKNFCQNVYMAISIRFKTVLGSYDIMISKKREMLDF